MTKREQELHEILIAKIIKDRHYVPPEAFDEWLAMRIRDFAAVVWLQARGEL